MDKWKQKMTEAKTKEEPEELPPDRSARWDRFHEETEEIKLSEDHVFWDKVYWLTKVVSSGFLFLLVLCSAVVSKGALLILTWNINIPAKNSGSKLKTLNGHFQFRRYNAVSLENPTLHDKDTDTSIYYIWALFLVVVMPNVFTVIFYTWRLLFRKTGKLKWIPFIVAFISATFHSVGLSFFVFYLLPSIDPISGLWYCCSITTVPCLVQLAFSRRAQGDHSNKAWFYIKRILAFVSSIASMCLWGIYVASFSDSTRTSGWLALYILSPLFVSCGWWETFLPNETPIAEKYDTELNRVDSESSENNNITKENEDSNHSDESKNSNKSRGRIQEFRYHTYQGRFKIYAIVNAWKIIVTFMMVIMLHGISCKESGECIDAIFGKHLWPTQQTSGFFEGRWLLNDAMCQVATPFIIAVVGILASFFCHRLSVAAIQIVAQVQSFSLPVCLTTPVTCLVIVITLTQLHDGNHLCDFPFPWWESNNDFKYITYMVLASVTGYISLLLLTTHIWTNNLGRMKKENMMFFKPLYCGTFLDQSLMLNRCEESKEESINEKLQNQTTGSQTNVKTKESDTKSKQSDSIPFIYLCATMWHETETEMTQLMKSLFRMDIDQCARGLYEGGMNHPDYYNFEVDIFFDDAFDEGGIMANQYVKSFVTVLYETARSTYPSLVPLRAPRRRITPYGGRLMWTLPGGNKLIAHLKDKHKIRRKKRWSQVMYMYYFLSHKLDVQVQDLQKQKEKAKNIFILALDGDVDFRPSAVKLLIDKMKRNDQIGAACGRIHPIGDGPMVWYQKFEYAVSHWLVKATEHITGCVLCSPGCFSLFRGSALMDCNVMKRYTTMPTQARHHIQYDQGEDRWLCTLLLKEGHKVDYCAASDAYTFAPEGFKEFYNQRRRWTPSTMANIMDLLSDWRVVTRKNDNVSLLYIILQMSWFITSIITPGVLLLMIVGATNLAYPNLSLHAALLINLIPLVIFVLACFFAKTEHQLNLAAALSICYSLVMMVVLVGLIREAVVEGFCSVITPFLLFVAGVFIIAGLTHPKETGCLLHGFLFFIAIPSMSMLLMIYSIINMNNVSWGTREAPKAAVPGTRKREDTNTVQGLIDTIINCTCCRAPDNRVGDEVINKLEQLDTKLSELESGKTKPIDSQSEDDDDDDEGKECVESITGTIPQQKREKYAKYLDFDNELLPVEKKIKELREEENEFWEWLIRTYLYPGEKAGDDKKSEEEKVKEQNEIREELKELRNKASLAYLLLNALFITVIFFLQQSNIDTEGGLSFKIECTGGEKLLIEPISMTFTVVFGILLLLQFLCMLAHRCKTFLQINSITRIQQDFDVDRLFMDVINEILEKKHHSKEEPTTDARKTPERKGVKGAQRLKDFIKTNLITQQRIAGALLGAKDNGKTDTSSTTTPDTKEPTDKDDVKKAGKFKTLANVIGRMNSTKRQQLCKNDSFRQVFLPSQPAKSDDDDDIVVVINQPGTSKVNDKELANGSAGPSDASEARKISVLQAWPALGENKITSRNEEGEDS